MPIYSSDGNTYETEADQVLNFPIIKKEPAAKEAPGQTSKAVDPLEEVYSRAEYEYQEDLMNPNPEAKPLVEDKSVMGTLFGPNRYVTWPEKLLQTAVEAFKLPGEVSRGEVDPSSPASIARAADLAQIVTFGPAPLVSKVVDGTLGSIMGVGAKHANYDELRIAQDLYKKGATNDKIWALTGWYVGTDNRWRWEMSDHLAKFFSDRQIMDKGIKFYNQGIIEKIHAKLPDVIDHPELFKNYPELKDVRVSFYRDPAPDAPLGTAFADRIEMNIDPSKLVWGTGQAKATLIHEIQHLIQTREGFSPGTNPDFAYSRALTALNQRLIEVDNSKPTTMVGKVKKAWEKDRLIKLYQDMDKNSAQFADHLYYRTPGEIEARISSHRYDWDQTTRDIYPPFRHQSNLSDIDVHYRDFRLPSDDPQFPVATSKKVSAEDAKKEAEIKAFLDRLEKRNLIRKQEQQQRQKQDGGDK